MENDEAKLTPAEVRRRIGGVTVWKRGDQRAPYKLLLLLLALANVSRGEGWLIPYEEVDERLDYLLREFGPPRKSCHPE